jgi:hypothetical protein
MYNKKKYLKTFNLFIMNIEHSHKKLTPERNIEFMYNRIQNIVFYLCDINKEEKDYLMQFFN